MLDSKQVRLAAYYVYANPTQAGVAAHTANLGMVARFVATAEDAYVDMLRDARRWLEDNTTGKKGAMRERLVGIPDHAMVAGMFVKRCNEVLTKS